MDIGQSSRLLPKDGEVLIASGNEDRGIGRGGSASGCHRQIDGEERGTGPIGNGFSAAGPNLLFGERCKGGIWAWQRVPVRKKKAATRRGFEGLDTRMKTPLDLSYAAPYLHDAGGAQSV